jgi:hypothetical protein
MDALTKLADASVDRIAPRRHSLRGAIAGAILYAGFGAQLQIFGVGTGFSLIGLLFQIGFGLVVGAVMGAVFGSVLGPFRHRGFWAYQVAGLSSGAVLVVPFTLLASPLLGSTTLPVAAGATLAFGVSLGTLVWAHARYRSGAA